MATGLFAPQDIYIFKIFVNKPYTKLYAIFLGTATALIYNSIAKYRRDRKPEDSIWFSLERSPIFGIFSWILSIVVLAFVTFYPLEANKFPMKWSKLHNSLFISLSRPAFMMALMLLMINMWLNHGRRMKKFLGCSLLLPFSKLGYGCYLVFPIVCATLTSSMSQSLFLSYPIMFYFLAFNIVMCFIIAFLTYLMIEAPLAAMIDKFKGSPESAAELDETIETIETEQTLINTLLD